MSLESTMYRTADVASLAQCSVQLVRNLADRGVLPPVSRSEAGYRRFGERHLQSVLAYRALTQAVGHDTGRRVLVLIHSGEVSRSLALLDEAHAQLHRERVDLDQTRRAADFIANDPIGDVRRDDSMTITVLADALGLRTSTLRFWETHGLIASTPAPAGRPRTYTPGQVRDVRVVQQLRAAGYGIEPLRILVPALARGRDIGQLRAAMRVRADAIDARSTALLRASSSIGALVAGRTPG